MKPPRSVWVVVLPNGAVQEAANSAQDAWNIWPGVGRVVRYVLPPKRKPATRRRKVAR